MKQHQLDLTFDGPYRQTGGGGGGGNTNEPKPTDSRPAPDDVPPGE